MDNMQQGDQNLQYYGGQQSGWNQQNNDQQYYGGQQSGRNQQNNGQQYYGGQQSGWNQRNNDRQYYGGQQSGWNQQNNGQQYYGGQVSRYQQGTQYQPYDYRQNSGPFDVRTGTVDGSSFGIMLLGMILPIVGLILYLVWHTQKPVKARSVGKGTLIGAGIWFIIILIIFLLFA